MKKKFLTLFLVLILSAAMIGCQNSTDEETTSEESTTLYGQVESIDGNEVTLALVQMPDNGNRGTDGKAPEGMEEGEMPEGEAPEGMENGEMPEGEMPEGMEEGEMPEGEAPEGMEDGEKPEGMEESEMPGMDLTGETKVITLTDDMLADIAVDDIIVVEMDGDSVVSATKFSMTDGGQGNRPDAGSEDSDGSRSEDAGGESLEDTADSTNTL